MPMRLCTYEAAGKIGVGVEVAGQVYPTDYTDMIALIVDGERGLERAQRATDGEPVPIDRLLAPIPRPGKIFGSGINYRAHGDEAPITADVSEPRWDFIKLSSAVIGPGEPIVIPPHDKIIKRPEGFQVDYEVEFVVVIGRRAKNVRRDEAMDYVFGYTLLHDVSARAVQFKNHQIDLGKSFDTFAPMGPVIVTKDEIPDLDRAHITLHLNGQPRQDTYLADQIFPPADSIEWLSSIITLEPGDCLSTGTPGGVGTFREPPEFLKPGDVVTLAETTIGELTNPVVAGE
jgi:2-keto-4-pentenoate hydratase/2-oxohepta-3-ene-1,7-dioic acid hydratase in catechol pathway